MRNEDMRFNQAFVKSLVGRKFEAYKCDAFDFTNSVTQIVGLYIGGTVYKITNVQEPVDYFGAKEDMAVCRLLKADNGDIQSAFSDVKQIITPVNEFIHAITLVNEEQKLFRKDKPLYDVWLTRGIIFHLGEREISFEKDDVPFSEEIIIQRGYNLKEKFESPCGFLDGWDDDYRPECRRDFVTIVK